MEVTDETKPLEKPNDKKRQPVNRKLLERERERERDVSKGIALFLYDKFGKEAIIWAVR